MSKVHGELHLIAELLWEMSGERMGMRFVERDNDRNTFSHNVRLRLAKRAQGRGQQEMHEQLSGMSDTVLENRLKMLESAGIIRFVRQNNARGPIIRAEFIDANLDEARVRLVEHFPVEAKPRQVRPPKADPVPTPVIALGIADVRGVVRDELERHRHLAEEQTARRRSGTILIVDYENASRMLLGDLGLVQRRPLELRIEEVCPPVLQSFLVCSFTDDKLPTLHRRDGYLPVVSARLLRDVGDQKDSVDPTVKEVVTFFCRHEDISHVVLFAGDHGYVDLVDRVRSYGREFFLLVPRLAGPGVSRELRAAVGDDYIISLKRPSRPISRVKLAT